MDTGGLTLEQELQLLLSYWPQINAVKHLTGEFSDVTLALSDN